MQIEHIPVLYQEVLQTLAPAPGDRLIDATIGGGGHAEGILEAIGAEGRLLGIDADAEAIERVSGRLARYGPALTLAQGNFRQVARLAAEHGFEQVDGVLMDLGVSSFQLDDAQQGFSFRQAGPLDMRLDAGSGAPSAFEVVNTLPEQELADVIYRYGEERLSRRIARAVVAARPIHSTTELAATISGAVGGRRDRRLHPATRTFQALRIYVNDELAALAAALPQALALLRPGGVLAVISFHSLEDRIVKEFMRRESRDCICPPHTPVCQCGHQAQLDELYRKGITPQAAEVERNPRSRSARLRAARRR